MKDIITAFSYLDFIAENLPDFTQSSDVTRADNYIKWLDGEEVSTDDMQNFIGNASRQEIADRFIETETKLFREALTAFVEKRCSA